MRDDPDVQLAVNSYRLVLPTIPSTQRAGELLGRGAGSSLEFQEYREYLPGDDVRHLDWAAYARSDALMVRLYREEISPTTEILLDASRSMTTSPAKDRVARQLAAALLLWTAQTGGAAAVDLIGDESPPPRFGANELPQLAAAEFGGTVPLPEVLSAERVRFRRHAVRIVISDFLFAGSPETAVRSAAAGAGVLWVFQLLSRFEADPQSAGGRRLIDVETGAEADVVLNADSIAGYKRRLAALQETISEECRRAHARFLPLVAERGLAALCRDELCAAGLLEPV